MGEGENNVQMYAVVDGEHVPRGEIGNVEFEPVKHRKISRKRFIKLCMAHGYGRNPARRFASAEGLDNRIKSEYNRLNKMLGQPTRKRMSSYADTVREFGW